MKIGNLEKNIKRYLGELWIAPPELISKDADAFQPVLRVERQAPIGNILKIAAMHGRAHSGINGVYDGRKFPDTSVLDINKVVGSDFLRSDATKYIQETFRYVKHMLNILTGTVDIKESYLYDERAEGLKLINEKGSLLFDLLSLGKYRISNPDFFIKGVYAMSQVDSAKQRVIVQKNFNTTLTGSKFKIGCGTCYVADDSVLKNLGISTYRLASYESDDDTVVNLHKHNLFIKKKKPFDENSDPNEINVYLRTLKGNGICDDATMLIPALYIKEQYGLEAAIDFYLGAMLTDTIDTVDKISHTNISGGLDEHLGDIIKEHLIDTPICDKNIAQIIYLGAKDNKPNLPFSSSVKYFNLIQDSNNGRLTAHEAHLKFLREDKVTSGMLLGFHQYNSENFYDIVKQRVKLARKKNILFS